MGGNKAPLSSSAARKPRPSGFGSSARIAARIGDVPSFGVMAGLPTATLRVNAENEAGKYSVRGEARLSMPEYRNRTDYARAAIEAYWRLDGATSGDDRQVTIVDLVTDLLLLAHREGMNPELIMRKAKLHLRAEADLRRATARADLDAQATV